MDQFGTFLTQYATKEVMTLLGMAVMLYAGFRVAKGSYGIVTGIAKKASFMGIVSAVMIAAGLGATGFGIGELETRPTPDQHETPVAGLTNVQIERIALSDTAKNNPEVIEKLLEYAAKRDAAASEKVANNHEDANFVSFKISGDKIVKLEQPVKRVAYDESLVTIDPVKEASVKAEESIVSMPIAWTLIGLGIASTISGATVFLNRHNKRNTDDPNHPNYESQYARTGSVGQRMS